MNEREQLRRRWDDERDEVVQGRISDDVRAAFRPEHPPTYHRTKLDRSTRFLWRFAFFCLGLAVLGAIARLFS